MSAVLSAIAIGGVAAVSAQAFTASSNVLDTGGGAGGSVISGYTVTDVRYTFGGNGSTITALDFKLDGAAGSAKATLNSGGSWHSCTVAATPDSHDRYATSCAGLHMAIASADQLAVVARQA
jgi:hypothetical protein